MYIFPSTSNSSKLDGALKEEIPVTLEKIRLEVKGSALWDIDWHRGVQVLVGLPIYELMKHVYLFVFLPMRDSYCLTDWFLWRLLRKAGFVFT